MKGRILAVLRSKPDVVSGEALSAQLGISRVAIWKHIRKLQGLGYRIEATPKGYTLISSPDSVFPWEFGPRAAQIHYFAEVASTMDIARNLAREGCPHLTVVIAERQHNGRGRLQRTWHSPAGGLYFTVVLRPAVPPGLSPRINLAASLYMAQTLDSLHQVPARVKWPNDILVADRKICGLLAEMEAETDRVAYINVGLGLNVNNEPPPGLPEAVSLKQLLGHTVARKAILAAFLERLEVGLAADTLDRVIPQWKKICVTLNRPVRVVTQRSVVHGTAVDIDDSGALILNKDDGTTQTVFYGDCFPC
jgi:BirA family biotin operon repressor/biotin-[acetyl-CoA-carboxylase] ligase